MLNCILCLQNTKRRDFFSKYNAAIVMVLNVNAIMTEMNTKVASIQVSFSSRCTPRNLFILTLFIGYVENIHFFMRSRFTKPF